MKRFYSHQSPTRLCHSLSLGAIILVAIVVSAFLVVCGVGGCGGSLGDSMNGSVALQPVATVSVRPFTSVAVLSVKESGGLGVLVKRPFVAIVGGCVLAASVIVFLMALVVRVMSRPAPSDPIVIIDPIDDSDTPDYIDTDQVTDNKYLGAGLLFLFSCFLLVTIILTRKRHVPNTDDTDPDHIVIGTPQDITTTVIIESHPPTVSEKLNALPSNLKTDYVGAVQRFNNLYEKLALISPVKRRFGAVMYDKHKHFIEDGTESVLFESSDTDITVADVVKQWILEQGRIVNIDQVPLRVLRAYRDDGNALPPSTPLDNVAVRFHVVNILDMISAGDHDALNRFNELTNHL